MEERRSEGSDPGNRTEPAPRSTTRTLASTVTRNGYVPLRQSFGKVGGTPQRLRSRWHVGEVALNDTVRRTSVQTTNCRALAQQMRRLRPTHQSWLRLRHTGLASARPGSPSEAYCSPGGSSGSHQVVVANQQRTDEISVSSTKPVRPVITRVSLGLELRLWIGSHRASARRQVSEIVGHAGSLTGRFGTRKGTARLAWVRTTVLNRARRVGK